MKSHSISTYFKFFSIAILAMVVHCAFGQSNCRDFVYADNYGDTVIIKNFRKTPRELDKTFFIVNINRKCFESSLSKKTPHYTYIISDIKRTSNANEYEFSLIIEPHTSEISEYLMYLGGPSHYRMNVVRENKLIMLVSIKYMYSEI